MRTSPFPAPCSGLCLQRVDIKRRVHPRRHAAHFQNFLIFPTNEWVFVPIGDGRAAIAYIDGAFVEGFFARASRLVRTVVVRAIPANQAQRLDTGAEMGMEPIAA